MKRYTVGFIFDPTLCRVVLIHKNRPDWQNGRMNGIGGHIEEGEESVACMVRETQEESGLVTGKEQWVFLGTIHEPGALVDFYATIHAGDPKDIVSCTDEPVEWCDVAHLPEQVLPNIPWLVAYGKDRLMRNNTHTFVVRHEPVS